MNLDIGTIIGYNSCMDNENIKTRPPTIYIAGPMRGIKDYNYPAFDRQAMVL